jgi:predicted nucleic acid-binding Zn ribbon protein
MNNNKLIECVACGNPMAYHAKRCRKCGDISNEFKLKKRALMKTLKYGFGFIIVIAVLLIFA